MQRKTDKKGKEKRVSQTGEGGWEDGWGRERGEAVGKEKTNGEREAVVCSFPSCDLRVGGGEGGGGGKTGDFGGIGRWKLSERPAEPVWARVGPAGSPGFDAPQAGPVTVRESQRIAPWSVR